MWSLILQCCTLVLRSNSLLNPKSRLKLISYKIVDSISCYVPKIIYTNDTAYEILCCEGMRRAVLTIRTWMPGAGGDWRADLNQAPALPDGTGPLPDVQPGTAALRSGCSQPR